MKIKSSKYKSLFILFCLVVSVWLIAGIASFYFFATWNDRGTFGDMFGAVNALFSGLAFAGVIYAIFLQRKELELQREELILTREELKRSADAQAQQVSKMEESTRFSILAAALNAYCQTVASSSASNPGGTTQILSTKRRDDLLKEIDKYLK